MSADSRAQAEEYKTVIENKIHGLVAEFAEGKISREQFHVMYERYSGKLAIATQAILSGNPDAVRIAQDGLPTVAIRDTLMGKAMGLMIYHNKSGSILETLGDFDTPTDQISPILVEFSQAVEQRRFVERRTVKHGLRDWLLYVPGSFTTVVTHFKNEPSQLQAREIERLHHDFEIANRVWIEKAVVDVNKLAYPFLIFVQKNIKK